MTLRFCETLYVCWGHVPYAVALSFIPLEGFTFSLFFIVCLVIECVLHGSLGREMDVFTSVGDETLRCLYNCR